MTSETNEHEIQSTKDTTVRIKVERTAKGPREVISIESQWNYVSGTNDTSQAVRMAALYSNARVLTDLMISDMQGGADV